jgi:hypothetical protein
MSGFGKTSRRSFLKHAGILGAVAAGVVPARAQDTLNEILQSPRRGNWDDQFDAVGTRAPEVKSRQPILSPATVSYVERAIGTIAASLPRAAGRRST